ncbi:MAG: ATP-binding protein [Fuerstiella sp.]|nr:ATP-binding protein [Fuerstiella sp.]
MQESGDACVVLRIDVSGTGIGIPEVDQERIFEPFVQGDSSTARTFGGMGTGLTLCRRLVTAMKGRIDLQSVPGKGGTFSVTLPLSLTTATSNATEKMADTASTSGAGKPDGVRPMNQESTTQEAWQELCVSIRDYLATDSWKESEAYAQQLHELAGVRGWRKEVDQAFRLMLAIRRRSSSQAKAIITRIQEAASHSSKTLTEVVMT